MSSTRCNLTLAQKIEVIALTENKRASIKQLQERFKCGRTQIYSIIKNKQQLKEAWATPGTTEKRKRQHQTADNDDLNKIVYDWFMSVRAKNLPVSGPMIKTTALKVAEDLQLTTFKASNGWLEKFRQRHNITYSKISGDVNDVNPDVVNHWPELRENTKAYSWADNANVVGTTGVHIVNENETVSTKHAISCLDVLKRYAMQNASNEMLQLLHALSNNVTQISLTMKTEQPPNTNYYNKF